MGAAAPVFLLMKWETVEMLGYAHYSELGYRVAIPIVRNDGYDFIAENNGDFVRVNVKMAFPKSENDRAESWWISRAGGRAGPSVQKTDAYLAFIRATGKFVELPGDFLANTVTRRIPAHMMKQEHFNEQLRATLERPEGTELPPEVHRGAERKTRGSR